jgi:hypothetical protein
LKFLKIETGGNRRKPEETGGNRRKPEETGGNRQIIFPRESF